MARMRSTYFILINVVYHQLWGTKTHNVANARSSIVYHVPRSKTLSFKSLLFLCVLDQFFLNEHTLSSTDLIHIFLRYILPVS